MGLFVQAFNGSMVYWYNSTSYYDDLAWAAAWLFKATNDPGYKADAYKFYKLHPSEGPWTQRFLVRLQHPPISSYLVGFYSDPA